MRFSRSTRQGAIWIAVGTVLFTLALVAFCWALGLNFQDEGWSKAVDTAADDASASPWWAVSIIGFVLSIIVFFIGVQKVSQSSESTGRDDR
ncbi:MAG: hypothetical protein AAF670_09125 [Planctomycetota bacterium]